MFKQRRGMKTFEETRKSLVHYVNKVLETEMDKNVEDGLYVLKLRLKGVKSLTELLEEYAAQLERDIHLRSQYRKNGKKYRKLFRTEVIKHGAMQSWNGGELQPVMNTDGKTIGSKPMDFSDERDFYNYIED